MIEIRDEAELERVVQEYQALALPNADPPADRAGDAMEDERGARRAELDAAIKAFYARASDTMNRGSPLPEGD